MPALRNRDFSLSIYEVLDLLNAALAQHMIGGTTPNQHQVLAMAETTRGAINDLNELRARLASLPGRPSDSLQAPYTSRLEADIGMMADALRGACKYGEAVDGAVLLGFALTLENLKWRAAAMESLLGITPQLPPPPPEFTGTRAALAAANGRRFAA